MSLDDEAQLLVDYGLTQSQATVYLAIVRLGAALVSKISRVSGVRREDVYRTLAHLEEMGLIEKMPTKPTKIRAMPLEQAISLLIERQKNAADRKISELTARKDEVLKRIGSQIAKVTVEGKPETEFALFSSKEEVLGRTTEMIQGAEKEIDAVTSASEFVTYVSLLTEQLKKSAEKGVKLRAILEFAPHQHSAINKIKGHVFPAGFVDIRYSRAPLGHYFITDFERVLMATSPEPPMGQHPYLWTCDEKFAEIMCGYFEETWHACAATSVPKQQSRRAEKSTKT